MARSQTDFELMFPSWSANGSILSESRTRRGRETRIRLLWRRILVFAVVVTVVGTLLTFNHIDPRFDATVTDSDTHALGLEHEMALRPPAPGNPWHRRRLQQLRRSNVVHTVAGCGGTYRRAAKYGDRVSLRYIIRDASNKITDSTSKAADVTLGQRQVPESVEAALEGGCGGEVVQTQLPNGKTFVGYIERVRTRLYEGGNTEGDMKGEMERLDWLSRKVIATAGRKGASCDKICGRKGLVCVEEAFKVVNNCPRLQATFRCGMCQVAAAGAAGADMPAWVSRTAPAGHARGACLVAPDQVHSTCSARYRHTKRLCACLRGVDTLK